MTEENRPPNDRNEAAPPATPVTGYPPRTSLTAGQILAIVMAVVVGIIALGIVLGIGLSFLAKAQEAARRASCMSCHRQIGLSFFQYAGDHDDYFPPLVGNDGKTFDSTGMVPTAPSRTGFLILLKEGYLTTTKVFVCPSSEDVINSNFPTDYKNAPLQSMVQAFGESNCSYGWDPTKKHSVDATCAILADNPPRNVSQANEGTVKNNSENHRGNGQNVFYNDGHVKWMATPQPDAGDDPDIYTGAAGYEKSPTDAKIIR